MLYGNDIDETTNPFEAGLGWTVKLDKGDFIGRDALARIKREGVARKLVGFEMTGRGIAPPRLPDRRRERRSRSACVTSGAPGLTPRQEHRPRLRAAALAAIGTRSASRSAARSSRPSSSRRPSTNADAMKHGQLSRPT